MRSLKKVSLKYPGSPEAIKAKEMIDQIKLSDSIKKQKKIYLNYKWIFTFNVNDTAKLKKIIKNLEEIVKETPYNHWFLSEDRFDQGQVYLVLHGIRNRRNLDEWKKKLDETDKETYNTNNFVVLSADYKNMLLNKIQLTNEK